MPDDQPPDLDGPPDQQPPDMPEPDNAPAVSRPEKPLFARAPAPAVGTSPLMAFILSVITDPMTRRQIEQAAWSLNSGLDEDHLLTKATALFSGVQQAHLARAALIFSENRRVLSELTALLTDLDTTLAERDARTQPETPDAEGEEPGAGTEADFAGRFGQLGSIQKIVAAEVQKAVDAAERVNVRNLKILCGVAFLLGIIFTALFVHFF